LQSTADHAGTWAIFTSGPGNINKDPADWNWTLNLNLPESKTITSMTMLHNAPGEGWSTTDSQSYLNKQLYPLVVFNDQGQQVDTAYDQNLGTYSAGTHQFTMYGQKEDTNFAGSELLVTFSDGTNMVVGTDGTQTSNVSSFTGNYEYNGYQVNADSTSLQASAAMTTVTDSSGNQSISDNISASITNSDDSWNWNYGNIYGSYWGGGEVTTLLSSQTQTVDSLIQSTGSSQNGISLTYNTDQLMIQLLSALLNTSSAQHQLVGRIEQWA